jgi:hypothetical protein
MLGYRQYPNAVFLPRSGVVEGSADAESKLAYVKAVDITKLSKM